MLARANSSVNPALCSSWCWSQSLTDDNFILLQVRRHPHPGRHPVRRAERRVSRIISPSSGWVLVNLHRALHPVGHCQLWRMNFCAFQNMIEKPEDRQIGKENCISMVQCKTIKQLELIEQKKFDDEDIQVSFLEHPAKESLASLQTQMRASLSRQPDRTIYQSSCHSLNGQGH